MKSIAQITNEFLQECIVESAAAAVKTQPAAVQKTNPYIPLQAPVTPKASTPVPVTAPKAAAPASAKILKAAAPAPVTTLKAAAPAPAAVSAPKTGSVITDEQLRALSRKHLLMMIRDLEIELAQAKRERDSLLIAYEAGLAEKTQAAQVA